MNISYNWLKDLIDFDLSPQELADKLTASGSTVEGIEQVDDDYIFDFDLTSNRGDCLSHLGIAREIAAVTNGDLRITKYESRITNHELQNSKFENQNLVTIEDADLCHRFTARVIRNVKIGASPEWLVKRLEAVGERSINNVADITNYVMHELGQPMHSFDFNKLKENRIVVRRAKLGESIKTLDEVERKLDDTMLAICDAETPVAIGGVMGGFDSGITEETTDVLLEVAYFDRDTIRQTSRKLKLSTEASHHFERGVDIENLVRASTRATELICEIAGGEEGEFIDVYPTKFEPAQIESNDIQFAVKRLTGLDVEESKILQILDTLGIKSTDVSRSPNHKSRIFTAPTWRHDISIEADLVEEAARIIGYNKIGEELPPAFGAGEYQPNEIRKMNLRHTLAALGFDEAISYSFIDTKFDEQFEMIPDFLDSQSEEKFVSLKDSVIEGAVRMRPSLLSGLLDAVRTNFNFQNRNLRLFEIGKIFSASSGEGDLPNEREVLSLILTGGKILESKTLPVSELDFYDAKGALENALEATHSPTINLRSKDFKHLRKGQSAEILIEEKAVGFIGRLSEEISANYKFKQPVFVAEIDLQSVLDLPQQKISYSPLSVFPASVRDVSLQIKRNISFEEIRNFIESKDFEFLKKVSFVDVFEGKGMADAQRSLTIRLEYRSDKKTLLDEEVDEVHSKILKSLDDEFSAKLK